MEHITLYMDEHVQFSLAEGLKIRGIDVITTQEAGNRSLGDITQLDFATKKSRVLFSFNKRHFAKIHYEWMKKGRTHSGIILSDQKEVGMILRRLMKLYFSLSKEDMQNRLEYLSVWK